MKCVAALLSLLALAYGQQCGREFEQFRTCVQKEDGINPPTPRAYPGGSVSQDIVTCFTSAGCQAPTLPGAEAAASELMMGALLKCSDEVKDNIKVMIQQCMVNPQVSPNVGQGFVLHPDLIAPLPLAIPNPPPAPPAVVILHSVSQIYNDHVCPTAAAKENAKTCVIRVYNKFIPTPATPKSPIVAAMDLTKHCYNQEVCKLRMTPTCQGDIENIRAYICNCAKTTFSAAANVNALVTVFKNCLTRETQDPSVLQKQSVVTFESYAQRLMTNLMCLKAPDPCKPPEVPQQQPGQPQPGAQPGLQG